MKRCTWFVAACAVLAACSPRREPGVASEPPPTVVVADAGTAAPKAPSLDSKESKTVARTLARVSRLRGLEAKRPVPGETLKRDVLVGKVKEKALREFPADALRREGQLLQIFGFAPTSFDYLNEMMTLLEAQLEGFYEPKNGTMYLAADLGRKEAEATLAHELVHALQDQSWDLKSRSTYRPGKGDETLALACLAEGEATSVMMDFMLGEQQRTALDLPDTMLRELMASGMNGAATQKVPHILRTTLIAPYIDGLAFVHGLRRKGGWALVDRAWAEPPTTTEQILHVEKWLAHEPPVTVGAPTAQALGAGWKRDDEDTFGELGFALAFEEWLERDDARTAAAGWGGDRSAVYTRGDEIAIAVHARYDAAGFAQRALQKLGPGLEKKLGKPSLATSDAVCFERPELGPLLVARKNAEFVLATGPARAGARWQSTSTCADAKRWADEVLGP